MMIDDDDDDDDDGDDDDDTSISSNFLNYTVAFSKCSTIILYFIYKEY